MSEVAPAAITFNDGLLPWRGEWRVEVLIPGLPPAPCFGIEFYRWRCLLLM
jgi:hypothetical protein